MLSEVDEAALPRRSLLRTLRIALRLDPGFDANLNRIRGRGPATRGGGRPWGRACRRDRYLKLDELRSRLGLGLVTLRRYVRVVAGLGGFVPVGVVGVICRLAVGGAAAALVLGGVGVGSYCRPGGDARRATGDRRNAAEF